MLNRRPQTTTIPFSRWKTWQSKRPEWLGGDRETVWILPTLPWGMRRRNTPRDPLLRGHLVGTRQRRLREENQAFWCARIGLEPKRRTWFNIPKADEESGWTCRSECFEMNAKQRKERTPLNEYTLLHLVVHLSPKEDGMMASVKLRAPTRANRLP